MICWLFSVQICYIIIVESLQTAAGKRLNMGLQESTRVNYNSKLNVYRYFCKMIQKNPKKLKKSVILALLEWLAQKGLTQGTVTNYFAALKYFANINNLDISILESFLVTPMRKALCNTLVFSKKIKVIIVHAQFVQCINYLKVFKSLKYGLLLALLLGYIALLRVSSYTVEASSKFNPMINTTLSDCKVLNGNLTISMKKQKLFIIEIRLLSMCQLYV